MTSTNDLALRVAARYKGKKKTEEGNTVYMYSERQIANRNKKKALQIEKLRKSIGKLRTKVKKDLRSEDPETMMTALAVALMDHTYERVGNDASAKDGHVGVTGWQKKHVTFKPREAIIKYVGKSGVKHEKHVTDASIVKALRDACEGLDKKTDEVLSWEDGRVTAEKVNSYLESFDVTAKDIRGFHANREMQDRLKAIRAKGKELPKEKKAKEKLLKTEFLKALDETAEAVGHEAATLRSQYLVPGLEDTYMKDGTVSSKMGSALSYEDADNLVLRIASRVEARQVRLDLDWVEALRKDFLTLMANVPRVKNYNEARTLQQAITLFNERFYALFFEDFLDDLQNDTSLSAGEREHISNKLRGPGWTFHLEFRLPLREANEYSTEEQCFSTFDMNRARWANRVKAKVRDFWKEARWFVEWYSAQHGKTHEVHQHDEERVEIEGFKVRVIGYNPAYADLLERFKEGLRLFRQRASHVLPILLRNMLPIHLLGYATIDEGGMYNRDHIEVALTGFSNYASPKIVAHVIAHEMAHHLWYTLLSDEGISFWETAIKNDYGDLDLKEALEKWPGKHWAFEAAEYLADTDPVLGLQLECIGREDKYQSKEDFQELYDSGVTTLRVPKTPITGYAGKSPKEAFPEAIGRLVAFGPATLDPLIKRWLQIILPNIRVSYDRRTEALSLDSASKGVESRYRL